MRGRADAVAVGRNPSNRGDLGADLGAREQPTDTRLRALTELDLDGADLRRARDHVLQSRHAEAAVGLAAAEVAGADLPHEIAAHQVVRRHAALSRALQATRHLAAAVERLHRRPAQRTEAHARDVDDRCRPEGPRPLPGSAHDLGARNPELRVELGISGMVAWQRKRGVLDDQVVRLQFHLVVGAETEVVVLALGGCVDPPPLVAAERTLLVVVGHDVLAELGADGLQPVAEVADDWKVSQDGALALRQVIQRDCHQQDGHHESNPDQHAGILYSLIPS